LSADISVRRICIQILTTLVDTSSDRIQQKSDLREFVVGTIVQRVCVQSTLKSGLDATDAATNILLQDLSECIHLTYRVVGEEVVTRIAVVLTELEVPADVVDASGSTIRQGDLRGTKGIFRKLLIDSNR